MDRKSWIWVVALLLILTVPVHAQSGGTIHLEMRYQGGAVSGGTVTIYDVTDLEPHEDPEAVYSFVKAKGIEGTTRLIEGDGSATFDELQTGIYLVAQETAPRGYYPMKPFCVAIPFVESNRIQYRVDASPKLQQKLETELPQTGQRNLPVWGLMGGGLALTVFGMVLLKRK